MGEASGDFACQQCQHGHPVFLAVAGIPARGEDGNIFFVRMVHVDEEIIISFLLNFSEFPIGEVLQIAIEDLLRCGTGTVQGSTILCLFASGFVLASVGYLAARTAVPDCVDFSSVDIGCVVAAVAD